MSKGKKTYDKISEQELKEYLKGKLTPRLEHELERRILNSDLEWEAVEGWEQHAVDQLSDDLDILRTRLTSKRSKGQGSVWVRIAAIGLLLIVSGFLAWKFTDQINEQDSIAFKSEQENEKAQEIIEEPTTVPADERFTLEGESKIAKTAESKISEVEIEEIVTDNSPPTNTTQPIIEEAQITEEVIKKKEELAFSAPVNNEADSEYFIEKTTDLAIAAESIVPVLQGKVAGVSVEKQLSAARSNQAPEDDQSQKTTSRTIYGIIKDGNLNEVLPGVTVTIKGTSRGVVSNLKGEYEILVEKDDETLEFSFIGFNTKTVNVSNADTLNIELGADMVALEEVVVVGYGLDKKSNLTGSIRTKNSNKRLNTYQDAAPKGGMKSFKKYLDFSKIYPKEAQQSKIKGSVQLSLSISESGEILNIEVTNRLGYGCDEEATRLIKEGPEWSPALENNNPVKSEVKIEVKFP